MDPLAFDQDTIAKIQKAKQMGYDDHAILQKAAAYQASKTQNTAPVQQNSGIDLADLLPLIGAVGGSFVPGLGTIVGGALGAGAGTLLKQGFKGKGVDLGEVAKETALGGVGGVVGKGVGYVGGKVLSALGGGLAGAGEDIGVRALRLNKGQLAGFLTKHGEDAGQFLSQEGAIGKNAFQLAEQHIEPLQQQFNNIAKKSGIAVNPTTFADNILEQYQKLISAGGQENAQIADDLLKEADYIFNKSLAPAGHDISKYDELRRTFAQKVNWNDPVRSTKNYALADALRKTAIDTADQAGLAGEGGIGLKDIGIKLSKFRDLENAAVSQEQLGRGNLPAGITKWLSILGGYGAAGPVGGAAGFAIGNLINNPDFLRILAQGAVKGGTALEHGMPSSLATDLLGRTASQETVRVPDQVSGGSPAMALPSGQETSIPQPSTMMASADGNQTGGDQKEQALRQVLASIMFSKAKNVSDIKTAYEFLNPSQVKKPLAAEQQKLQKNAESGLAAVGKVKQILAQDPYAPLKAKIPIVSGRSPYAAAAKEVADVYTRLRTGAALNKEEQTFYDSQLPQPFDSAETVQYKLQLFESLFQKFAYGQQSAIPDTNISIPSPY
jgi:hypothetical protein